MPGGVSGGSSTSSLMAAPRVATTKRGAHQEPPASVVPQPWWSRLAQVATPPVMSEDTPPERVSIHD